MSSTPDDEPNDVEARVAKKCRRDEEHAVLFSEFGKMFEAGLKAQNEGYRVLQEAHKKEMQGLVDENKALIRQNAELGMEVSRLKQKLDKAKAALRVELETGGVEQGEETSLREKIRLVRLELARAEGVAAFYIFPNKVLDAIVRALPGTMEELMAIHGIGPKKAGMYGQHILQVINSHHASKKSCGETTQTATPEIRLPVEST
jgi:superfamily II DNA helicase RecQ